VPSLTFPNSRHFEGTPPEAPSIANLSAMALEDVAWVFVESGGLARPQRLTKPRFPRKLVEAMAVTTEASQVFAGQSVGIKQVSDHIWLVTFMDYDLGYFDDETCRLEPLDNPFGPKVLPMSPV
jgi:hypothetical protein